MKLFSPDRGFDLPVSQLNAAPGPVAILRLSDPLPTSLKGLKGKPILRFPSLDLLGLPLPPMVSLAQAPFDILSLDQWRERAEELRAAGVTALIDLAQEGAEELFQVAIALDLPIQLALDVAEPQAARFQACIDHYIHLPFMNRPVEPLHHLVRRFFSKEPETLLSTFVYSAPLHVTEEGKVSFSSHLAQRGRFLGRVDKFKNWARSQLAADVLGFRFSLFETSAPCTTCDHLSLCGGLAFLLEGGCPDAWRAACETLDQAQISCRNRLMGKSGSKGSSLVRPDNDDRQGGRATLTLASTQSPLIAHPRSAIVKFIRSSLPEDKTDGLLIEASNLEIMLRVVALYARIAVETGIENLNLLWKAGRTPVALASSVPEFIAMVVDIGGVDSQTVEEALDAVVGGERRVYLRSSLSWKELALLPDRLDLLSRVEGVLGWEFVLSDDMNWRAIPSYRKIRTSVEALIAKHSPLPVPLTFVNIPPCQLPEGVDWERRAGLRATEQGSGGKLKVYRSENQYLSTCRLCIHLGLCPGILPKSLKLHGMADFLYVAPGGWREATTQADRLLESPQRGRPSASPHHRQTSSPKATRPSRRPRRASREGARKAGQARRSKQP